MFRTIRNMIRRFFCRIGWHAPMSKYVRLFDGGASVQCRCRWCGYTGLIGLNEDPFKKVHG